jgi:hypothetical protein
MTNGKDSINPIQAGFIVAQRDGITTELTKGGYGLTKREYFAAMAMMGIKANSGSLQRDTHVAELSVKQADALIKALNEAESKQQNNE